MLGSSTMLSNYGAGNPAQKHRTGAPTFLSGNTAALRKAFVADKKPPGGVGGDLGGYGEARPRLVNSYTFNNYRNKLSRPLSAYDSVEAEKLNTQQRTPNKIQNLFEIRRNSIKTVAQKLLDKYTIPETKKTNNCSILSYGPGDRLYRGLDRVKNAKDNLHSKFSTDIPNIKTVITDSAAPKYAGNYNNKEINSQSGIVGKCHNESRQAEKRRLSRRGDDVELEDGADVFANASENAKQKQDGVFANTSENAKQKQQQPYRTSKTALIIPRSVHTPHPQQKSANDALQVERNPSENTHSLPTTPSVENERKSMAEDFKEEIKGGILCTQRKSTRESTKSRQGSTKRIKAAQPHNESDVRRVSWAKTDEQINQSDCQNKHNDECDKQVKTNLELDVPKIRTQKLYVKRSFTAGLIESTVNSGTETRQHVKSGEQNKISVKSCHQRVESQPTNQICSKKETSTNKYDPLNSVNSTYGSKSSGDISTRDRVVNTPNNDNIVSDEKKSTHPNSRKSSYVHDATSDVINGKTKNLESKIQESLSKTADAIEQLCLQNSKTILSSDRKILVNNNSIPYENVAIKNENKITSIDTKSSEENSNKIPNTLKNDSKPNNISILYSTNRKETKMIPNPKIIINNNNVNELYDENRNIHGIKIENKDTQIQHTNTVREKIITKVPTLSQETTKKLSQVDHKYNIDSSSLTNKACNVPESKCVSVASSSSSFCTNPLTTTVDKSLPINSSPGKNIDVKPLELSKSKESSFFKSANIPIKYDFNSSAKSDNSYENKYNRQKDLIDNSGSINKNTANISVIYKTKETDSGQISNVNKCPSPEFPNKSSTNYKVSNLDKNIPNNKYENIKNTEKIMPNSTEGKYNRDSSGASLNAKLNENISSQCVAKCLIPAMQNSADLNKITSTSTIQKEASENLSHAAPVIMRKSLLSTTQEKSTENLHCPIVNKSSSSLIEKKSNEIPDFKPTISLKKNSLYGNEKDLNENSAFSRVISKKASSCKIEEKSNEKPDLTSDILKKNSLNPKEKDLNENSASIPVITKKKSPCRIEEKSDEKPAPYTRLLLKKPSAKPTEKVSNETHALDRVVLKKADTNKSMQGDITSSNCNVNVFAQTTLKKVDKRNNTTLKDSFTAPISEIKPLKTVLKKPVEVVNNSGNKLNTVKSENTLQVPDGTVIRQKKLRKKVTRPKSADAAILEVDIGQKSSANITTTKKNAKTYTSSNTRSSDNKIENVRGCRSKESELASGEVRRSHKNSRQSVGNRITPGLNKSADSAYSSSHDTPPGALPMVPGKENVVIVSKKKIPAKEKTKIPAKAVKKVNKSPKIRKPCPPDKPCGEYPTNVLVFSCLIR